MAIYLDNGVVKSTPQQNLISKNPSNYTYAADSKGGVNYFLNGKPITNNQYAAGTGQNIKQIQSDAKTAFTNVPAQVAPTDPNGTSGSGSAAAKVDKSNDIALNNAGLSAVDTQENGGISAVNRSLDTLRGRYDSERTTNEGNYTDQSNTNQNNLQKNKQTAYVNAAQGRSGLFGKLASIGAFNGDGIELANRAVKKGADDDLSGAADNYGTNQQALDTSIATFRTEDDNRRKDAETAAENARLNVRNDAAKSRMSFLSNLSNDYAAMGDEGQARSFSDRAAALYPTLATTAIPNATPTYSAAAFTPGSLSNYIAGAGNTTVSTTDTGAGGALPGLVATAKKKQSLAVAV